MMRFVLVLGLMAGFAGGSAAAQNNPPLQEMQPSQDSLLPPSLRNLGPQPPAGAVPQAQTDINPPGSTDLQGAPPPDMTPQVPWPNKWVPATTAKLQVLDKVNALTSTLVVRVGQTATFESLTIAVKACAVRPSDQPADATVFLEVTDNHPDSPGFTGWMLANEPAISMMQSAIYDIRVSGCA
ncbi:MAG: DUF2155 domain-containing protein [Rhodopila sp.]